MLLYFLDLSFSLKSCVAVLAFEDTVTSSSLYWQPSGMKCLLSALLQILRLSQAFSMDMPAPHFLFPVRGEFLRLYAFSWFHKARLSADSLLLAFLGQWGMLKCLCLLPILQGWASFLPMLANCPLRFAHTALKGSHSYGVDQCVGEECRTLEVTTG